MNYMNWKHSQGKSLIGVMVLLNSSEPLNKSINPSGFTFPHGYYQWVKADVLQTNRHLPNTSIEVKVQRGPISSKHVASGILLKLALCCAALLQIWEGWVANPIAQTIRHSLGSNSAVISNYPQILPSLLLLSHFNSVLCHLCKWVLFGSVLVLSFLQACCVYL